MEPHRFRLFNRGYYWGTCRVCILYHIQCCQPLPSIVVTITEPAGYVFRTGTGTIFSVASPAFNRGYY
jgi:hypothetical protein